MRKSVRYIALALILGISVPAFVGTFSSKEVSAYSTSSLPTTIDLNDTSAANIRSYYSSLNNLDTSERQGTNLLKNLKTILKNGQKYYSYDSGNAIWQIYEIADRDWAKSPASSTQYGSYNSSTNKITNYTYGTSSSSSKNNPYIHALYINRNVTNQTTAWDDHNQDEWGINREHVWPKAEGFEESGAGGARGDPMHLMAGNGYSNNIHSNYYYGYVKTSGDYTDCGDKYSNQSGNLRGTSKTLNSGTVFEPQDCDKGDIARAIFYMVARYNYLSGSDSDGINSNNPNLELTQKISDWASSGYSSTTSKTGKMGILTDLLNWHHSDPVDEYEIHRNNLLYNNYTNNRNPFIDFPEWVDYIWGTATYSGTTYQSYSSTPTGYATPSSDTINGYNSATGISISETSLHMTTGDTAQLSATLTGLTGNISWTTSNSSVASLSSSTSTSGSNITVTAAGAGSATITAKKTVSGTTYSKTCEVTVSAPKTLSSIALSGQYTTFTKGDTFAFGGTVTATYSDGSTVDVTALTNFTGYNMNTTGEQTVTASYTYGETTKTATYKINVNEASQAQTATIAYNDTFSPAFPTTEAGVNTSATQHTDTTSSIAFKEAGIYKGSTNNYLMFVKDKGYLYNTSSLGTINSVSVTYTGGTSTTGKAGVYFGSSQQSTYTTTSNTTIKGQSQTDTWENNVSGNGYFQLSTSYKNVQITRIEISYGGTSSKTLSSISLDTTNVQTEFATDDEFNYDNLVVTAHYSDNTTEIISSGYTVSEPDMSSEGEKTVIVEYGGKTNHYTISITNPDVYVDGVSLNTNSTSISVGENYQLVATVSPSDATNKDVSWSSDDESIAEVSSSGLVTAKAVGTCTITVTTDDGEYTDECDITVTNSSGGEEKNTTLSVQSYASANNWQNSVLYDTMAINSRITATAASDPEKTANSGKYYTSGHEWRFYQGDGGSLTITASNNCTIESITFTFVINNTGALKYGTQTVTSGTPLTINASSALFTIGNSGTATNGQIKFTNFSVSYLDPSSEPLTSITATPSKTFKVGEAITTSDITVTGNNGADIVSFSFTNNNYQFKYEDAASGGAKTNKVFANAISATVSGTTYTCSLTVKVIREAYERPTNSTYYTGAQFVSAGVATAYTEDQVKTVNGMSFTIDGYVFNNKLSLSETKTEASGSIKNNTAYSAGIYKVEVNGANPDIQVSTNGSTWVDLDNADVEGTNYVYFKVFYKNTTTSTYVNISSIVVKTKTQHTPTVVSNYIMFEDTEGQCEEKLDIALVKLNDMSNADKSTFMTSNDYVIKTARERINAWATNQGKTLELVNNTFVLNAFKTIHMEMFTDSNNATALIAIMSVMSVGVIGSYFFLRKKKEN